MAKQPVSQTAYSGRQSEPHTRRRLRALVRSTCPRRLSKSLVLPQTLVQTPAKNVCQTAQPERRRSTDSRV